LTATKKRARQELASGGKTDPVSAHVMCGRLDRRRRIASSCRNAMISNSLKSVERPRRATI